MATLKIGKGFGKRLRKLRKAAGLTQAALGEKVGVSPVSIAQYEAGACRPRDGTLKKLATFFVERPDKPPVSAPAKKRGRPRLPLGPVAETVGGEGRPLTRREIQERICTRADVGRAKKARGRPKKAKAEDVKRAKRLTLRGQHNQEVEQADHPNCRHVIEPCPKKTRGDSLGVNVSPVRLGSVSRDWIEAQVDSHVHARGWMAVDGPARIVCLRRADLVDLCRTMVAVGGVRVEEP